MTKAKDLRDKSIEELEASYEDVRRDLFQIKNELKRSKKIDNPHLIRLTKKEIARLLTIIHEKQSVSDQSAM